ncbi:MAG: galactose-1-phosphate uridylyltransferase [Thermoprotei archaeon]|nr:MAG: galactose-1-phosphate uridylyltransferase [Thermoprotei archaeon]
MSGAVNELRWNPLLREWIIVSSGRERRPWRPKGYCPFCPGAEETGYGWDVLVLDNKFPALVREPRTSRRSRGVYRVRGAYGYCKVLVETPQHEGDLCDLSLSQLVKVIDKFAEVYEELGRDPGVRCVMEFRNKGEAIGVSLTHPHSQIYALPFIPTRVRRELRSARSFARRRGECLFCHILKLELKEGVRVVYENEGFVAFVPFFAMWPLEVHVYPRRHVQSLPQLTGGERLDLAKCLKVVTYAYNRVFDQDMPYMMVLHQAPTDGRDYSYYHMHLEFYPILRDRGKLKYAAGIEWGAGTFTYDGLPEANAARLREALAGKLAELVGERE